MLNLLLILIVGYILIAGAVAIGVALFVQEKDRAERALGVLKVIFGAGVLGLVIALAVNRS